MCEIVTLDTSVNKESQNMEDQEKCKVLPFKNSNLSYYKVMYELEDIFRDSQLTEVGDPLTQEDMELLEDLGLLYAE